MKPAKNVHFSAADSVGMYNVGVFPDEDYLWKKKEIDHYQTSWHFHAKKEKVFFF